MILTVHDESYPCAEAVKGNDFILLLDANGSVVARFDGVSDFSIYSLTGGDWSSPEPSPQEDADALLADHEERLIYLELGV